MGNKPDYWSFREAAGVKKYQRFIMLMLFLAGCFSLVELADWWFRPAHVGNIWFFIVFSFVFWYGVSRLILIWINYLRISKPEYVSPEEGLSVAIFTTCTNGEPLSMFEKTLEACQRVRYPHTTYLLADRLDKQEVSDMAARYGAVMLDMAGTPGAKAGKINRALGMTTEDFVLVLDPDHIVFPNFLDQTLGFFRNPDVGFVQVSQAYYNQYRSFTALGAAEQTYSFYGPTQMGLHGLGCSVAIGANCTFRRKALESIGGHAVSLAEDLLTSMRLHAAGWKSVYNPVVVSRGLVPEDFGSFCKQQLKWSRGVFELVFVEMPKLFRKFTAWQKLSYSAIGTYYLVGATSFFFILIPFVYFISGMMPATMSFVDFILKGTPVVVISSLIYFYAQNWMADTRTERGFHWRAMVLKYASWPVYFLGFLLSIVDVEIPYIPTEKRASIGHITPFARPLLIHILVFGITTLTVYLNRRYFLHEGELLLTSARTWGMIGFAAVAALMSFFGLFAAWGARRLKPEDPWEKIDVQSINN